MVFHHMRMQLVPRKKTSTPARIQSKRWTPEPVGSPYQLSPAGRKAPSPSYTPMSPPPR